MLFVREKQELNYGGLRDVLCFRDESCCPLASHPDEEQSFGPSGEIFLPLVNAAFAPDNIPRWFSTVGKHGA